MSWLNWFRRKPEVSDDDQLRLAQLVAPEAVGEQLLTEQRFVVVDLEATGLNTLKDKILSIGAVVIQGDAIDMGQQFERTLKRREHRLTESVLIHQLAPSEIAAGVRPKTGLLDFMDFVGDSPLLAFHADFDQRLLCRELRDFFAYNFKHPFFDLAEIAPMLYPQHSMRSPRMDDWVDFFGLQVLQRHNACADAMVTAELMLILLKKAQAQGIHTLKDLDVSLNNWRRRQSSTGI